MFRWVLSVDYIYIYILNHILLWLYSIYLCIYSFRKLLFSWIHQAIFLRNLHQAPDLSCSRRDAANRVTVTAPLHHCTSTLAAAAKSLHLQFAHLFLQKMGDQRGLQPPRILMSFGKLELTVGIFVVFFQTQSSDTSPKIKLHPHWLFEGWEWSKSNENQNEPASGWEMRPLKPANLEEDGGNHGARHHGRSKDIKRSATLLGVQIHWSSGYITI